MKISTKMALFIFFVSAYLISITTSEEVDLCFNEKIGDSVCKCQHIASPEYLDAMQDDLLPKNEIQLSCNGEHSLAAADESLIFRKYKVRDLSISSGIFDVLHVKDMKNFPHLKNLTLSGNQISTISIGAFKHQNSLELLDLSFNNLSFLPDLLFEPLTILKNLTLSSNQILSLTSEVFKVVPNLLYLDLSNNQLSEIDCNVFASLKNLLQLFLNNNRITHIGGSFNLLNLQKIDLSLNYLKVISNPLFSRLKNLRFLSLAMNELTTLNESVFKTNTNLETVNLTGNLWMCDRRMLPLLDSLKKFEAYREGAVCLDPPELHNYTVQHALEFIYLQVKTEESPTCNKTMCNCTISKDKLVITVDCSGKGFTRLPEVVPYKTRALNLYNNKIKSLSVDHLDFVSYSDVSFLYLNNNIIDTLKGLESTWLLRNLVALHLSNNRLTEIPIHMLEQFKGGSLDELYLSDNPWNCDCNTVRFQTWLQDSYRAVRRFDHIRCSPDSGIYAGHPIYLLKKSQLCPQQVQFMNYLDILNGLMSLAIFLILVKLSYDYWLQKRTGKLPRFFSLNLN